MSDVLFWRIEFEADGAIKSITECDESVQQELLRVVVVPAFTKEEAIVEAKRQYLQSQQQAMRTRRAQYRRLGLCKCGRKPPKGQKTCTVCLVGQEMAKSRAAARARGELVVKAPKSVAFAQRKAEQANEIRLAVIREVRRRLNDMEPMDFVEWLHAEEDRLSGNGQT